MHKILIVDDNDDLRMIMVNMLKDFRVLEAKNGEEAIQVYKTKKPDLVYMDILMPVKDGIEATTEIINIDPQALIIAITAYSSRSKEILLVGAKEALIKPVRGEILISKIKEYLD